MNCNELKNEIIDYISQGDSIYDICTKVYMLLKEECPPTVLEFFFIRVDSYMGSEAYQPKESEVKFLEEKYEKYGKAWDEILKTLFMEKLEKEEFYAKLWALIVGTPLFETSESQVGILCLTCMNLCIPYSKMNYNIIINDEQYVQYGEALEEVLMKARSIVFQPCSRRTDRAFALLELLEQCDSEEEKAVLFVKIIQLFEKKAGIRLSNKKIEE